MTRQELFDAMLNRTIVKIRGHKGMINAIAMEDGSGFSFNVTIDQTIVYVRCPKPLNVIL